MIVQISYYLVITNSCFAAQLTIEGIVLDPSLTDTIPYEHISSDQGEMPRFPGCEYVDLSDRDYCIYNKMSDYFISNIRFPVELRDERIQEQEQVIVKFIVEKDGRLNQLEIIKARSDRFTEEALRLVQAMPRWISGTVCGKAVRTIITLPINFNKNNRIPPPPPLPSSACHFGIVDQMPRFPGCETLDMTEAEKKECSQQLMIDYIYQHLKYPEQALKDRIEGICVVRFLIGKTGNLSNFRIVRDLGSGTGQAALDVIQSMNNMDEPWLPGRQRGRLVQIEYSVPVKFVLPDKSANN